MAVAGESSHVLPEQKPVVVRVKRKANQSPIDAFWLEINERPQKRALLELAKLSLSDDSHPKAAAEELKTKKVFVRHVETVRSFDTTIDIVKSFVDPTVDGMFGSNTTGEERRHSLRKENKQERILSRARQTQEVVAKNARFEQIWRSRKGKIEEPDQLHEMCQFYDVIRVDVEEGSNELKQKEELSLEEQKILQSYLPLLREFIPNAALEVESDLHAQKQESEEYVYDVYAVNAEMDIADEDSSHPFPLVQVDDDDFYDVPDESEYDSEDSNDENNPKFDYPDEDSEDEDEDEDAEEESDSEASDHESKDEGASERSLESHNLEEFVISGDDHSIDCSDKGDWIGDEGSDDEDWM